MKTEAAKFIILAASALFASAVSPSSVLAQDSLCPGYASLVVSSSKAS